VAVVSLAAEHAVAVVSLNSFEVLRKVAVGRRPAGVAVDPRGTIALVANRNSGSVSLLSLETYTVIGDVAVGRGPSAVAINPETQVAAVTNSGDGSVTLLGLQDPTHPILIGVISLPHSRHHADAWGHGREGRDQGRGYDHGDGRGHGHDRGPGDDGRRARPAGIAFDFAPGLNRLVVTDPGRDALHLVTLNKTNEPTAIETVHLGRKPIAVAVHPGGDFALVTSDNDDVFGLQLSTRAVVGRARVGKHPRGVAIDPRVCRAVVTNHQGGTASLLAANCAPRLTELSPPAVLAGTPLTLTVRGVGFRAGATVNVGAWSGLVPSTVAPEVLSVGFTAPSAPGSLPVSVTSAGQTANSLALQVVTTPPPVLTRLSPGSSTATGEALTLVLDGERFAAGARVIYAGQPLPPATVAGCAVPACVAATIAEYDPAGSPLARLGLTLRGGVFPVLVENPDGARTEPRSLVLANPTPVLSSLVPNTATQGTDDKIITIIGDGFVADLSSGTPVAISQVLFNGVPVPAVPYGPNPKVQLTATVPASMLQAPGVYSVTVVNPTVGAPPQGGGESFVQPFTVTPRNAGMTIRTVATGGSPGVVAAWRQGTSLLAAAGLSHEGAVVLLDVTDPTSPRVLSEPVALTSPAFNTVGDLAINALTGRLVATLPSPAQVAVIDVTDPLKTTWATLDLAPDSLPFAVAVDETRNRAVVVSQGDFTVSVIDLAGPVPTVSATFPLPGSTESPVAIAVNPVTNVAVVLDQRDSELTGNSAVLLVDLVSGATEEIEVQLGASSVAVNSVTNRAVVTNQESNTASIVDLALRRRTADVPVGHQPSGVAIDPAANQALVANIQNNEITAIDLTTLATEALFMGVLGAELPVDIQWLPNAVRGVAVCGTLIGGNVVVLGIPPGILP
jgi:YVTN family beta-propeller protein